MKPDAIKQALLESYARDGGINHLDGVNLPSQDSVAELARDCMHVLFPGYFESSSLAKNAVPVWLDGMLTRIDQRLTTLLQSTSSDPSAAPGDGFGSPDESLFAAVSGARPGDPGDRPAPDHPAAVDVVGSFGGTR